PPSPLRVRQNRGRDAHACEFKPACGNRARRGLIMATNKRKTRRQATATTPDHTASDSSQEGEMQVQYDADALLDFYREMVELRLFEDAAQQGFRQGKIGGYLHVYSGQEPTAMGFIHHKQEGDRTITAYRDHPHAIL